MRNAEETITQKEIPNQLGNLRALLERLDSGIGSLEAELEPVLNISLKESRREEDEVKPGQLAPLADEIREQCAYVEVMLQRVSDLRRRLQV